MPAGNLTQSLAMNIKTVEGNPLALFIDNSDSTLKLKDVRGNVAPLSDYTGGGTASNITVDVTTITDGGNYRVAFQSSTNKFSENAKFTFNPEDGLGVGVAAALGALHIKSLQDDADTDSIIEGSADFNKQILFKVSADPSPLNRWGMNVSGAEAGADAGSNYNVEAYDDNGDALGTWMHIVRSSGWVGINTIEPLGRLHIYGSTPLRFIMDAAANIPRILSFRTDGDPRWAFRVDDTESGANAGSNMFVRRYDDTGTLIGTLATFVRSSGDTYLHNTTGIGYSYPSTLNGMLNVRGASDATGSAMYVQSLSNEAFRIYNNRQIVSGGGSAATLTDFTWNAFTAGSSSNLTAQFADSTGTDNIIRICNSPTSTRGGLEIVRSSTSAARNAFRIFGAGTANLTMFSNGTIQFDTANAFQDAATTYIQRSSTSFPGFLFNLDTTANSSFVFHKGRTTTSQTDNVPLVDINTSFTDSGTTFNGTVITLGIRPTLNYTGGGTANSTGIDYNPTITSLNGSHVGLRIRLGLSGFGLASTLPGDFVDVAAATSAFASLRIRSSSGTNPTSPNDGAMWWTGSQLSFRVSSTTRGIAFNPITQTVNATTATTSIDLSLGSIVILNLQTATTALTLTNPAVGTYIIIVKQDGTGGRLLTYTTTINWAGGVTPTLTTTADHSDIETLVYDGTNYRGVLSSDFAV